MNSKVVISENKYTTRAEYVVWEDSILHPGYS
jgi:hypothetical protein